MTDLAKIFTGLLFYAYVEDTPTVEASPWQLPIVSTVFNNEKQETALNVLRLIPILI